MAKKYLLFALLLGSNLLHAETPANADPDGYTRPLDSLEFEPSLKSAAYEQSAAQMVDVYDPWEPINRRIYQFNYYADQWVLLPLVRGYKYVTPEVARTGVTNFFNNIGDIGNLLNSILQLKGEQSMRITARLLFNTTIGVAGLWDPATLMGLPREKEDFGITLGHYGVGNGPYIVLPLFGPSNLRDTTGFVVDTVADNGIDFLNVATESNRHLEIPILKGIDIRYNTPFEYGQLNTPFEYLKVRYLYTQLRQVKINSNE